MENGNLRPLEPVDLIEGQEVEIIITDNAAEALVDSQMSLFSSDD